MTAMPPDHRSTGTPGPAAAAGAADGQVGYEGDAGDPHLERYAARTAGMTASEIRALFAVANRPEVVSLAGGSPYTAALPLAARSMARTIRG